MMPVKLIKKKNGSSVLRVYDPTGLNTLGKVSDILSKYKPDEVIIKIDTDRLPESNLATVFKRLGTICGMIHDSGIPLQLTGKMIIKARGSRPVPK